MRAMPLNSVYILNMSYTGLSLARSFRKTGIKVYGIGSKRWACGNFSRYVDFKHSPDSLNQKSELCEVLIHFSRKEPTKPLIFPTRDHDVIFLRDYRDLLESFFVYTLPSNNVMDSVLNKWKLYMAATAYGVYTPKTFLAKSREELRETSRKIGYPALLKPVYAADWRKEKIWEAVGRRKAILVRSKSEVLNAYTKFRHLSPMVILQEYVEGEDSDIYTFCSYCDKNSNVLAFFNTRKIRQAPGKIGTGVVVRSCINKDITAPSLRLLKAMRFCGISEIEYKWNPQAGKYYLIEVNPRFWDQHELSKSFNLDLPIIVYNDLLHKKIDGLDREFQETTWIADDAFLLSLVSALIRDRKEFFRMLKEVTGRRSYAIWDLSDPLPFVVSMLTLIGRIFRKVFGEIRRLFKGESR